MIHRQIDCKECKHDTSPQSFLNAHERINNMYEDLCLSNHGVSVR